MLTHIRMKNFKSWKDSGEVKLAPLTGFFGANSSGKSSLLQMLLLLKQTIGSEKSLFFGDENSLVNLGSFDEVIHRHDRDAQLELEFGCSLREPRLVDIPLEDDPRDKTAVDGFTFNTVLSAGNGEPFVQSFHYVAPGDSPHMMWETDGNKGGSQFLNRVDWRYAAVENCYGVPRECSMSRIEWNREFLRQFSSIFEELFSDLYYLASTRAEPRRQNRWEGEHPIDVGKRGHDVISALLSDRVKHLGRHEKQISAWLRKMKLAHSFVLSHSNNGDEKNYEIRLRKNAESPAVTLVDMGYGLSQFLPVLVLCYYVPEGSTLILEQPGIHLHPMVQSQLADLLIEVVTERKLQVIVESHSEHLLVRLQRRIAEGKISKDKIGLYFCRNDEAEGVSKLDPLDVDRVGNIRNWPENFFGDVMGDMFAITDAQAKQLQRQEEGGD